MRAGPAEPQSSWMHSSQPTPTGKRGVTFLARRRGEVRILPIPSQGFTPVAQVYIYLLLGVPSLAQSGRKSTRGQKV